MKEILFKQDEANYLINILNGETSSIAKKIITRLKNCQKKIKVSSAKGKGRTLQYWVCERVAEMFGVEFNQQDDNCPVHSREMGLNGVDVILRGELADKFPYSIECKCCENLSLPQWIRQARANKKPGQDYLLVIKKKSVGSEPVVVMDWDAFQKLVEEAKNPYLVS